MGLSLPSLRIQDEPCLVYKPWVTSPLSEWSNPGAPPPPMHTRAHVPLPDMAAPSVTFVLLTSPLEGEGAPEALALPTETEEFHPPP